MRFSTRHWFPVVGQQVIAAFGPPSTLLTPLGTEHSFASQEAAVPLAYRLNGGNWRDTGHCIDRTPTAAVADDLPAEQFPWLAASRPKRSLGSR